MSTMTIIERTQAIAERVASREGLEIVEVEWKGAGNNRVLRVFLDKPGGVTLADCEKVSHELSVILDVEEVVGWRYTLEVSSPGLDRKLLTETDYQRFAGKKARVKLRNPIEGRSHFVGRLAGCGEGQAEMDVEGDGRIRFSLHEVAVARLVAEF